MLVHNRSVFNLFEMTPPWPDGISRMLAGMMGLFGLAYAFAGWPKSTFALIACGDLIW